MRITHDRIAMMARAIVQRLVAQRAIAVRDHEPELVARGFSVAGRPLPEGMTIRGSPMGSVSAAQ